MLLTNLQRVSLIINALTFSHHRSLRGRYILLETTCPGICKGCGSAGSAGHTSIRTYAGRGPGLHWEHQREKWCVELSARGWKLSTAEKSHPSGSKWCSQSHQLQMKTPIFISPQQTFCSAMGLQMFQSPQSGAGAKTPLQGGIWEGNTQPKEEKLIKEKLFLFS